MTLKTSKSTLKRFKITKTGKFLHRRVGQNHFNAKDPGSKTRAKRNKKKVARVDLKNIRKSLPHI